MSRNPITSRVISKYMLIVVGNWADAVAIVHIVVRKFAGASDVKLVSIAPIVEVGRRQALDHLTD